MCERPALSTETYSDTFEYQGVALAVDGLERAKCGECGEVTMFPAQLRANHLRIADRKRTYAGLLTSEEIKSIRGLLGLSQADAAAAFGGGPNGFSKYERGEVIQSAQMDKLLRATVKHPDLLGDLRYGFEDLPFMVAKAQATIAISVFGATCQAQLQIKIPSDSPSLKWNSSLCANDELYAIAS